jgi:hypothetical protein
MCEDFAQPTGDEKGVVFSFMATSATSIKAFSNFPGEEEYVLLPSTKMKITNKIIDPHNKNLLLVTMEEVPIVRNGEHTTEK